MDFSVIFAPSLRVSDNFLAFDDRTRDIISSLHEVSYINVGVLSALHLLAFALMMLYYRLWLLRSFEIAMSMKQAVARFYINSSVTRNYSTHYMDL